MGEKKDSGSKDADNFGAEFGTDQSAAQRQAAMRRNEAVQRSRSRAGDDRASGRPTPVPVVTSPNNISNRDVAVLQAALAGGGGGGGSTSQNITRTTLPDGRVVLTVDGIPISMNDPFTMLRDRSVVGDTDPTGGQLANATLTAVSNTQTETDAELDSIPYMGGTSLREELMREAANVTDRDTRNFGAEFGGINPITADVSPVLALTRNAMNQGSGIASLPGVSPTSRPTGGDDTNQGRSFANIVTSLPASATTLAELDAEDADPGTPVAQELDAEDAALAVSPSPLPRPVQPNFITRGLSALSDSLGQKALAGQIRDLQEFMEVPGAKFDYTTRQGVAPAGRGELRISPNGFVTYSGPKDASYTGPFANLVNPPERPDKDVNDPCPPGFQLIDGVCRPMFDIAGPATPAPPAPGSNFQMAPTSGFPTSFAPMTQATPVSLPDPFVLSPTGAAVGRRL